MITTATDKPEDKREKLKKLREFHQATFIEAGVPDATFIPKMAYRPYGKTELHIGFFLSEISKGDDIYIEFTSKELVPEDPDRKLYRWRFNPHFEEEYQHTETTSPGKHRYLIPIDELVLIEKAIQNVIQEEEEEKEEERDIEFPMADPDKDLPIGQLTIRDFAAIMLKKPVSDKPWLNKIITKK